jgi:hypothetical protein
MGRWWRVVPNNAFTPGQQPQGVLPPKIPVELLKENNGALWLRWV